MCTLMHVDRRYRSERKVGMLHTDPSQQPKIKYIMNSALPLRSSTENTRTSYKGSILNLPHFAGIDPGLFCLFGFVWLVVFFNAEMKLHFPFSQETFMQHFLTEFRNIS